MNEKEFKESFVKFSQSKHLVGYAYQVADRLISGLGETNIKLESKEAVLVATAKIWEKLASGNIQMPVPLHNPEGFWMQHFKRHIEHFLLKRYARRSSKKSFAQYETEVRELEALGVKNPKPSKYNGARFQSTENDQLIADPLNALESGVVNAEQMLGAELTGLGLKPAIIELILMRHDGLTYKEIGNKLDKSEDAVRQRLKRGIERAGLTREKILDFEYE